MNPQTPDSLEELDKLMTGKQAFEKPKPCYGIMIHRNGDGGEALRLVDNHAENFRKFKEAFEEDVSSKTLTVFGYIDTFNGQAQTATLAREEIVAIEIWRRA